jgi:hypothetical protein
MRDALGNVTAASAPHATTTATAQFVEWEDRFTMPHDFLSQGTDGTLWSGFLGQADDSAPEVIAASDGVLRLQSRGTVWDGGRPLGAFLFKRLSGDFVVEATVADYAGLASRKVPGNNDGGLMVRVPRMEDAGPGEDLVQLNFFPIWNQGNMVTTLDGGRLQKGNGLAWDAHRHLQIIRQGARFHFRTSADGEKVTPPSQFALEYWTGSAWESTPGQTRSPAQPAGRRANVVHFPELKLQQLRAVFTHGPDGRTGVTDDDRGGVQPPASYTIETWTGSAWREVPDQVKTPALPVGSAINTVRFPRQTTTKFRVVFTHQGQARSGLTEILAWAD